MCGKKRVLAYALLNPPNEELKDGAGELLVVRPHVVVQPIYDGFNFILLLPSNVCF